MHLFYIVHITLSLLATTSYCDEANGQKASFNVKDKDVGKLDIHATKTNAKITAVADSVSMVVEPGTQTIPLKDDKKDTKSERRNIEVNQNNEKKIHGKKRAVVLSNHFLNSFLKSRSPNHKSINEVHKTSSTNSQENTRKSNLYAEMKVHGQSGGLRVHTNQNITTLTSETGGLDVFIKNPMEEKNVISKSGLSPSKYTFKKDTQTKPHPNVHIIDDVNGLKKSVISKKKSILDMKAKYSNKHPCAIPPCTPLH